MASHGQQLLCKGIELACLISSRSKKKVKVSWCGRKQRGRGLRVQDDKSNCARTGLGWLSKILWLCAILSELPGIWHFASHSQAGAAWVSRDSFMLCCFSGPSCSSRIMAWQEAPGAQHEKQPQGPVIIGLFATLQGTVQGGPKSRDGRE